jgi:hypothetical protein
MEVRRMAKFSELIKNFDKIRDYMRDFFIYGFKARGDFTQKSLRTYDNERRRIESYLGEYIKWDTSKGSKRVFISLDSSKISQNPLYSAWKSKSFTDNDVMLHFYILDILKGDKPLNCESLTNIICEKSGVCFDPQTVRIKLNEYVKEGILNSNKVGKNLYYRLCEDYMHNLSYCYENAIDGIKYYQEAAPFGVIGSYLLDNEEKKNDIFAFKHHFVVHTLEDKILLDILNAMREKRKIKFVNQSKRLGLTNTIWGIPLKIFVSSQSGRRYLTIYNENRQRFINHRLDYIKSVEELDCYESYDILREKLNNNLNKCWGVSFGGNHRGEMFTMKLYIDEEREAHIINRLYREGRGGQLSKIDKNIYQYSKEVFDTNEIMHWVKSFTGRIISVECESKYVVNKFNKDMKRMYEMYIGGEE